MSRATCARRVQTRARWCICSGVGWVWLARQAWVSLTVHASLVPRPFPGSSFWSLAARGHSVLFSDANSLFALTPEPTNQLLRNDYVIIVYGTCNNVNGGTRNNLHVLSSQMAESTRCDALRQCSCVAVLSTLSERYINKHLTRSKHKQQVTAGIKLRTLDAFCKCI